MTKFSSRIIKETDDSPIKQIYVLKNLAFKYLLEAKLYMHQLRYLYRLCPILVDLFTFNSSMSIATVYFVRKVLVIRNIFYEYFELGNVCFCIVLLDA